MKTVLLFLLALGMSITCNKGKRDEGNGGATFGEIGGVYIGDGRRYIRLCLSGYATGYYFLVKTDSSGVINVVRTGRYEYRMPTDKNADYSLGPPGYGLLEFMDKSGTSPEWSSYVFFKESGSERRLVIDTFRSYNNLPFFDSKNNFGFSKYLQANRYIN